VIRLALRVRREDAELALAELLELVPGGVEERDLGDRIEYAIYGAPGELPALPDLEAAAGDALVEVRTTELADDWGERWKAFHQPVDIGPLRVRPPWSPASPGQRGDLARHQRLDSPHPPGECVDVVIDPGQAFGTGGHHTTRLCLELLLTLDARSGPLVDLGCGSGVLGIAAAKLGWAPVHGVDFDPVAVEATVANARVNGVAMTASRLDLRACAAPSAPTVVANLLRPLLLALRFDEPPQTLIASGLLTREADEVAAALAAAHDLVEVKRLSAGEWSALMLGRG
jgi:ribosomal protein L11 methyltransferase